MIKARPLCERHLPPRRLSELTDTDYDDENEKKNVHFTSRCDVRVRTAPPN